MGLVLYVMITRCCVRYSSKSVPGLTINGTYIGQAMLKDPNCLDYLFQEDLWQDVKMQDFQDLIERIFETISLT
jgi:hypothetical protein